MRFSRDARQEAIGKITFTAYDDFGRVIRVGEAETVSLAIDLDQPGVCAAAI